MRKLLVTLMLSAVLAVWLVPAFGVDVPVDPNSPGAARALGKQLTPSIDTRLRQRVTITTGQIRLHALADRVTKTTGVTIKTGGRASDWQVRDIPIVVCVKDLPLGYLLKALADSTHCLVSSERTSKEDDPAGRNYRIWRNRPKDQAMTKYFEEKAANEVASAQWSWDAAVEFDRFPDSEFSVAERGDGDYALARPLSRLLSKLDNSVRDEVVGGKALSLDLASAPEFVRGALKEAFAADWQAGMPLFPKRQDTTPDWDKSLLVLYRNGKGLDFAIRDPLNEANGRSVDQVITNRMLTRTATQRPVMTRPPIEDSDFDFKALVNPGRQSDNPLLEQKIKLEAPKDKKTPTYADLFAALSKAAGCSIICEDFASHRKRAVAVDDLFGKEMTVGQLLEQILRTGAEYSWDWFMDAPRKLLIGRARDWPEMYAQLVPESYLTIVSKKANIDGLGLDDYLAIQSLTGAQIGVWISDNRDLDLQSVVYKMTSAQLWMLYSGLTEEDKARARSENGLPLARLDRTAVLQAFGDYISEKQDADLRNLDALVHPKNVPQALIAALSDPDILAKMTMRVKSNANTLSAGSSSDTYEMTLEWMADGPQITKLPQVIRGLPIYSGTRKNELLSKANK